MFSMLRSSTTSAATSIATKPSMATFQSRLPTMPSSASVISSTAPSIKSTTSHVNMSEELDRRDKKLKSWKMLY